MMPKKTSLDKIFGGALNEMFNREMERVAANICDANTSPKDKRQITIKLTVEPDDERQIGKVTASVESKLSPPKSVRGKFVFGYNPETRKGEATELKGEMLGQIGMDDYDGYEEAPGTYAGGNVIDLRNKGAV